MNKTKKVILAGLASLLISGLSNAYARASNKRVSCKYAFSNFELTNISHENKKTNQFWKKRVLEGKDSTGKSYENTIGIDNWANPNLVRYSLTSDNEGEAETRNKTVIDYNSNGKFDGNDLYYTEIFNKNTGTYDTNSIGGCFNEYFYADKASEKEIQKANDELMCTKDMYNSYKKGNKNPIISKEIRND